MYDQKPDGYYDNVRTEILPLLPAKVGSILEIGSGSGGTLDHIRRSHRDLKTAAVELIPQAAAEARKHVDQVIEGDIETIDLPFAPKSFDAILCLDVLEHLRDPWGTVRKLTPLLSAGGCIIASIPNVRHFTVSIPLLLRGEWKLTDEGILDRTHLRFFTKRTAAELMTCSGLRLDAVVPRRGKKAEIISFLSLGLLADLVTFIYLIKVSRAN